MEFFVKGMIIGFSIAAPVGPIGVLCIKRTLLMGRLIGFLSGLGAASADAAYSMIAAFGITLISNFLIEYQDILRLIGGCFLCYLAVVNFRSKVAEQAEKTNVTKALGAYLSTLFLTFTNPMTIIMFIGIFAGLGLSNTSGEDLAALFMVSGVFAGSCAWWLILSLVVGKMQSKFDATKLIWVNRLSGIVMGVFGLAAIFGASLILIAQ